MPMYELGLPVSSQGIKISHNNVDYNLVESVFGTPATASTNLRVSSSAAGDNTQNLVIYGIVAGVEVSESFALNGTTLVAGALDFTEVFEAYLDAVCVGNVLIEDSAGLDLGTILAGRRVLSPDVFKRVGKDGNEVILPLNGGCEYIAESLDGEWKKGNDADIVTYTAMEFRFAEPAAASANLRASSSAAGDTTQTLTVTGLVAGVEDTEDFVLNGVAWIAGAKDFTEVWKMELDAVCTGTVTLTDSIPNTIYVLPIGDLLRERFTSLMLGGESNSAGDLDYGWLNNHHPFVMMNDAELTVELEIPTPVTGAPTHDIFFEFYIRDQKELITPTNDPNFILVRYFIDENGLILQLYKEVGGVNTLLWDGSTADGNTIENVAGDQFWIFRFLFHDAVAGGTPPENVRHMHVYAKHGSSRATAEAATEEELIDTVGTQASPYDISDLLYTVGYPAYQIISANETWFGTSVGSQLEAISTYLKTSYPALFAAKYDFTDADYGDGDVELWDMKGSVTDADFQQVFDEDHAFGTYDIVLQNGLVRLIVDRLQQYGLEFYSWTGLAWVQPFDQLYFHAVTSAKDLSYPVIKSIESISPEKTAIVVRLLDSATVNDDYYVDVRITLERGKYSLKIDGLDVFPDQDMRFRFLNSTTVRFGFIGDDDIGDDDIDVTGNNTTLTDNFLIAFDDAGTAILGAVCTDEKPAGGNVRFQAADGGYLVIEDIDATDTAGTIIWVSLIPFPLVAGLFLEGEDGPLGLGAARLFGEPAGASTNLEAFSAAGGDVGQVLTIIGDVGGVRTTDTITLNGAVPVPGSEDFDRVYILTLSAVTAGNITVQDSIPNLIHTIPAGTTHVDNCMVLGAQTEYTRYDFNAGTDLPAGRYFAFFRVADLNELADDVALRVTNSTDAEQRGEQNSEFTVTAPAASAYGYFGEVFDILEEDVAGLDNIRMVVTKDLVAGNEIYVDYWLIVPIGDGRDWPGDLAHAALRSFTKPRRLYVR